MSPQLIETLYGGNPFMTNKTIEIHSNYNEYTTTVTAKVGGSAVHTFKFTVDPDLSLAINTWAAQQRLSPDELVKFQASLTATDGWVHKIGCLDVVVMRTRVLVLTRAAGRTWKLELAVHEAKKLADELQKLMQRRQGAEAHRDDSFELKVDNGIIYLNQLPSISWPFGPDTGERQQVAFVPRQASSTQPASLAIYFQSSTVAKRLMVLDADQAWSLRGRLGAPESVEAGFIGVGVVQGTPEVYMQLKSGTSVMTVYLLRQTASRLGELLGQAL